MKGVFFEAKKRLGEDSIFNGKARSGDGIEPIGILSFKSITISSKMLSSSKLKGYYFGSDQTIALKLAMK